MQAAVSSWRVGSRDVKPILQLRSERIVTTWIFDNGELREARPEELKREPVDISKIRVGDTVTVSIPGDKAVKFLNAITTDEVRDTLALPVGRAFMAWTDCCDAVLDLFVALARIDRKIGVSIFSRVRADSVQREITIDTAKSVYSEDHDLYKRIKTTLRRIDDLAYRRNVFAHVSFGLHFDENYDATLIPNHKERWPSDEDAIEVATQLTTDLRDVKKSLRGLLDEMLLTR